jgi:hypothetical protein
MTPFFLCLLLVATYGCEGDNIDEARSSFVNPIVENTKVVADALKELAFLFKLEHNKLPSCNDVEFGVCVKDGVKWQMTPKEKILRILMNDYGMKKDSQLHCSVDGWLEDFDPAIHCKENQVSGYSCWADYPPPALKSRGCTRHFQPTFHWDNKLEDTEVMDDDFEEVEEEVEDSYLDESTVQTDDQCDGVEDETPAIANHVVI